MTTRKQSSFAFLVIESIMLPPGSTTKEYAKIIPYLRDGFAYRKKLVDQGKALWYVGVKDIKGMLLLKISFEELQEFLQYDPLTGIVKRQIFPMFEGTNMPSLYERFAKDLDNIENIRPDVPIKTMDSNIAFQWVDESK